MFRLFAHAVLRDSVKLAGKIRGMTVGKMAAVREIHRQNLVTRFQDREIDSHVGLRAAVRLHIYMLGAKQSL